MTQQTMPQPDPDFEDPGIPERRPRKPRSTAPLAACIVVAIAILGCLLYATWPYLRHTPVEPATHLVVYEVDSSGTTRGFLTIEAPTGTQQSKVDLPSAGPVSFPFPSGAFVYLSVQNQNASGSVTCRITDQATTGSYTSSTVISENTSSGGYVIATCQGKVP